MVPVAPVAAILAWRFACEPQVRMTFFHRASPMAIVIWFWGGPENSQSPGHTLVAPLHLELIKSWVSLQLQAPQMQQAAQLQQTVRHLHPRPRPASLAPEPWRGLSALGLSRQLLPPASPQCRAFLGPAAPQKPRMSLVSLASSAVAEPKTNIASHAASPACTALSTAEVPSNCILILHG